MPLIFEKLLRNDNFFFSFFCKKRVEKNRQIHTFFKRNSLKGATISPEKKASIKERATSCWERGPKKITGKSC